MLIRLAIWWLQHCRIWPQDLNWDRKKRRLIENFETHGVSEGDIQHSKREIESEDLESWLHFWVTFMMLNGDELGLDEIRQAAKNAASSIIVN